MKLNFIFQFNLKFKLKLKARFLSATNQKVTVIDSKPPPVKAFLSLYVLQSHGTLAAWNRRLAATSPWKRAQQMLPSTAKALSSGRDSGLDASAAADAWAAVRAAGAQGAHLLVEVSRSNALVVVASPPSGGFDTLRAALLAAPDRVLYGALPFSRGGRCGFAFFSWIGPAVGGMARARVALQRGGVAKALEGCSADLQWTDSSEVQRDTVVNSLRALPGAGEVALL